MELIDAQAVRHAVCNVDIPDSVTEEQFYAVMNNVAGAVNKMSATAIPNCAECKHWDSNSGLTARKCDKWDAFTTQWDYCSYGRKTDGTDNP